MSKALKRFQQLKHIVEPILALDSQENYNCLDDAVESIMSELELSHDFSPQDADDIETIIGDWWDEV